MKKIFAPGCALMLYKLQLAEKLHEVLNNNIGNVDLLETCCKRDPDLEEKANIINVCPGCDKRFRNDYKDITTTSLWEILA
jgi:hypothetical protein